MRATGLVAALALLWGSGYFWIKLALGGFTPVQLTFGRLALGALVLVPIVLIRRLPGPRSRAMWGHLVVSALLACAIPYTLFALAEQTVSSSLAGVLNSTTPLWTVLLAASLRTEGRLSARRILGVIVGFAGAVVVVDPWSGLLGGSYPGMLACLAAALSYAIAYTYQGRYLTNRGVSPITLTAIQLSIAAAMLAVALPFTGAGPSSTSPIPWIAVTVLGAAGTGLALIINFTLIGTEGATAASVVTYLVPAVALALGIAILNEPARATLPIGAALILLGVTLVRYRQRTAARAGSGP